MRTFRYILSLLAATLALLAQPAMAQAPETSTKAQPSDPVFPYLIIYKEPHTPKCQEISSRNRLPA